MDRYQRPRDLDHKHSEPAEVVFDLYHQQACVCVHVHVHSLQSAVRERYERY